MTQKLSGKRLVFCQEYLIDLNATQAAIRAGYSPKTARSQGQRLLTNVDVAAQIAELQQKRAERTEIDQNFVLERWAALARVDPNELMQVRVGACRYCHGRDHKYQWRTEEEFYEAQEAHFELPDAARVKKPAPTIDGGYGYSVNLPPVETCPNCDGVGLRRVVLNDTTMLSPEARALFAGVKETQHGIEVKVHDQMHALDQIARHLGMFPSKVEVTGENGGPVKHSLDVTKLSDEAMAEILNAATDKGGHSGD